eukprot:c28337_g1_i2 orf=908-1642(-)
MEGASCLALESSAFRPAHTLYDLPLSWRQSGTRALKSLAASPSCSLQADKVPDNLSSFGKPFRNLHWVHATPSVSLQRSQPEREAIVSQKYLGRSIVSTRASSEWVQDVEKISLETAVIDIKEWIHAVYVFTRPYTILGTTLQAFSASLLAVSSTATPLSTFLIRFLQACVAAVCVNIFTSGINEIVDVNLDKINKPYLPLPSGRLSMATAMLLVGMCAVLVFIPSLKPFFLVDIINVFVYLLY